MAALSSTTVIVEAASRSGSLGVAQRASELGRSVGAVPGPVTSVASVGPHRLLRDGTRFLLIIFKIGTLFSPLKIFAPVALLMFFLASGWYGWTFITMHKFTNMSALLYTGSVITFMMGLISEQITALMYKDDS